MKRLFQRMAPRPSREELERQAADELQAAAGLPRRGVAPSALPEPEEAQEEAVAASPDAEEEEMAALLDAEEAEIAALPEDEEPPDPDQPEAEAAPIRPPRRARRTAPSDAEAKQIVATRNGSRKRRSAPRATP